jgi:hypothetical protein
VALARSLGLPDNYASCLSDVLAQRGDRFSDIRLHEIRKALGLTFCTEHSFWLRSDEAATITIGPGSGVRLYDKGEWPHRKPIKKRTRLDITSTGLTPEEARTVLEEYLKENGK